ncbi:hypothetical protein Pint_07198 [Pistacia integerrima]|uniref:Uncharacterized protein n=1 Tax=Pistacia integerrima TaxID=434235 RepID=A0ACC0Y078_9ROSI|nr:hypothetical protein Pint_07198 [Pistacia integerrima]
MEHWLNSIELCPAWLFTGVPFPSQELIHVFPAKARTTCVLEWRALREAGFTEQRQPPALGSGMITS